jgi:hypothetical protein
MEERALAFDTLAYAKKLKAAGFVALKYQGIGSSFKA